MRWKEDAPRELSTSSRGAVVNDTWAGSTTVVMMEDALQKCNIKRIKSMPKKWTVEEVNELFADKVGVNFAATDDGQAHLNRIAKAITNESLDKRVKSTRVTNAKKAFDKKVSEYAATKSPKLDAFVAGKEEWIKAYIARNYETEED